MPSWRKDEKKSAEKIEMCRKSVVKLYKHGFPEQLLMWGERWQRVKGKMRRRECKPRMNSVT